MPDEIKTGPEHAVERLRHTKDTLCGVIDGLIATRALNDAPEKKEAERELAACPYCGCTRILHMSIGGTAVSCHCMTCEYCHARGPDHPTRHGARSVWNKRAERKD